MSEIHENTINVNSDPAIIQIPVVVNGLTSTSDTSANRMEHNNDTQQLNVHKILIIGDSHVRGAAGKVQHNLTTTFGTSGFTSPGTPVSNIISAMTSVIKHLSGNDVLVLRGGANDIHKNNSWDALKCIASFIEENKHTNVIILCPSPLRLTHVVVRKHRNKSI
jgi:hypothetical protein